MRIMVLNDGETYTDLDGCMIVDVDDDLDDDDIEAVLQVLAHGEPHPSGRVLHRFDTRHDPDLRQVADDLTAEAQRIGLEY